MYVLELAGEDDAFAAAEARTAAADLEVLAPGLATASDLDRERFAHLAFAHRASEVIAQTGTSLVAVRAALADAPLDGEGTVAVRARDVRGTADIETQAVERALGDVLVEAGHEVDLDRPDRTLVALFAADVAVLGWVVARTDRGYGARAPTDRPFFQPGSMDPQLARAVVNLTGVEAGDRFLDPMCGTGGLLIEAGLVGATPLGFDAQRRMVAGSRRNLVAFLERPADVGLADATALPLGDGSVDAVAFDAPYGRQSKIASHEPDDLLAGALREAERVAPRGVFVADRDAAGAAEAAGWTVQAIHERRVHRSLTRFVHVLE